MAERERERDAELSAPSDFGHQPAYTSDLLALDVRAMKIHFLREKRTRIVVATVTVAVWHRH